MSLTLDKCNGIILFINLICRKIMTILTNAEVTAWLNSDSAIRGTLVEVEVLVGNTETTRYLSSFAYVTSPTDIPSNTYYEPIISKGVSYTESMDYEGSGSMLVGDIELNNLSGEYDSWINDIWSNRRIRAFIGDITWSRDKFIQVLDGVVAGIDSKNPNVLNIKIRDKLQRLNTSISEINYSDIHPFPDSFNLTDYYDPADPNSTVSEVFMPCTFGEVHNITPVLIDSARVRYCVNYGASIGGIIEVRDNGIPLNEEAYQFNTSQSVLSLTNAAAGTITCSVRGMVPNFTVAGIIKELVVYWGKVVPNPATGSPTTRSATVIPGTTIGYPVITPSSDRFVDGTDIDSTNFNNFSLANPQPVGFYMSQKQNLLATCKELAASVGASMVIGRDGKLRLIKLASPPLGTPTIIDTSMYKADSLQIVDRTDIQGAVKIRFNRNWTVQKGLKTNVPNEHKALYAEEWSTVSVADPEAVLKHKLTTLPNPQETHLQVLSDATAEAERRLALWSKPHTIYKISGYAPLLNLQIGDTVQLISHRYGLNGGDGMGLGTVVMLQPNWTTATVEVGIFI